MLAGHFAHLDKDVPSPIELIQGRSNVDGNPGLTRDVILFEPGLVLGAVCLSSQSLSATWCYPLIGVVALLRSDANATVACMLWRSPCNHVEENSRPATFVKHLMLRKATYDIL